MKNKKILMVLTLCSLGGFASAETNTNPTGSTIEVMDRMTIIVNERDKYINNGTIKYVGNANYTLIRGLGGTTIENNGTMT